MCEKGAWHDAGNRNVGPSVDEDAPVGRYILYSRHSYYQYRVGSLAGYPLFLYAKRTGMFDISTYHYPVTAAIIIILTLFVIQMLLAIFIAKSVRKDSLIERIRFSE